MFLGYPMFDNTDQSPEMVTPDTATACFAAPWIAQDWSCKAMIDFVLSLMLFVIASPVMALVALLVRLSDGGPALYCQTRTGKNGRLFTLVKFRTMLVESERNGACWSRPGDPRITSLGRFLRRTHLDELPQLWNVLRGDMSLVGPRPERPEFVSVLMRTIPHYGERLLVRPGITGLAQVQLPADTDLNSVQRKLGRDLFYVNHANPWLDLRIIAATALKVVGIPFPALSKVCLIPLPEDEPIAQSEIAATWNPFARDAVRPVPAVSEAS